MWHNREIFIMPCSLQTLDELRTWLLIHYLVVDPLVNNPGDSVITQKNQVRMGKEAAT
jgi:hypothetical protein